MTLGTNIQRLRKEHNMSQGDLADALDISRQSVSKWETDTATPDLDKLLKLSEIFGISLDELVKGADDAPPSSTNQQAEPSEPSESMNKAIPVTIKPGLETRQIAGIILLCMAFLIVLVFTPLGGILSGLIFSIPFVVCGIICLMVRKHTGLYCAWAVNIMLILFLQLATGASYTMPFNLWAYQFANPIALLVGWAHLIFILILMYCTVRTFRNLPVHWDKRKEITLIALWLVYLVLHFPRGRLFGTEPITSLALNWAFVYLNAFLGIARMILLTVLIIYTLNWYAWRKSNHTT